MVVMVARIVQATPGLLRALRPCHMGRVGGGSMWFVRRDVVLCHCPLLRRTSPRACVHVVTCAPLCRAVALATCVNGCYCGGLGRGLGLRQCCHFRADEPPRDRCFVFGPPSKVTHSLEVATEGRKVAEAEGQRVVKMLADAREDTQKFKGEVSNLQRALEAQTRVRPRAVPLCVFSPLLVHGGGVVAWPASHSSL
jgi:hypothetical protein